MTTRDRLPSTTYLFVVGTVAVVGAVISALELLLSDTDREWAVAAYAGGLGLAAAAGVLVAVMAAERRKGLLPIRRRASRLVRTVESIPAGLRWSEDAPHGPQRAYPAVYSTVAALYGDDPQSGLVRAEQDAQTLLEAGALADAERLLDAVLESREILQLPGKPDASTDLP